MAVTAELLREALAAGGPNSIGILGGARGTNEDAFAWASLADALGLTRRDAQLGDGLPAELLGLPRATIAEAANARTIVLLGPDLKEELPVLYLRLRDAAEQRRSRILEFSPGRTGLTRYAWKSVRYEPGDPAGVIESTIADAEVAAQLASGDVVVVAGRVNLAESEAIALSTLTGLLEALGRAGVSPKVLPALRRGNVVGALQLGLRPPAGTVGAPVLEAAAAGELEVLVLLGADPLADCPDAGLAERALAGARRVVSIDTFLTASTARADVVLPAAAFGEKSGTTTNLEGRVSPVAAKITPHGTSRPDWMIAAELAAALGHDLGVGSVDDLTEAIAATVPAYAGITRAALAADPDGLVAVAAPATLPPAPSRAGERNSYDYRLVVSRTLYDAATGTAMAPSLAPLAQPAAARVHPLDLDKIGVPEGTEVRLVGLRGSAVLPLRADDRVARGTVWSAFNAPGGTVADVIDAGATVTDVRIERL
jgi:NADH-quinone oxidoreductase subunit G